MSDDEKPLDPHAEKALAQVRRFMMIASATTFIAIAIVLGVIGYRVFHTEGRVQTDADANTFTDVTALVPAGAMWLSTAIGSDHIVVTIEIGGVVELRTFDPDTLKAQGRLQLKPQP